MTTHRTHRTGGAVGVAVIAALALGLALVSPAAAATVPPAVPDAVELDDACNDVPDAGFSDIPAVGENTGTDVVHCLAAYGITQGTGDGSAFEPNRGVRRWEMAVFLARLAAIAALQLDELELPTPAPTDFDDIDALSDEAVAAISVLAQLDVARGTTPTTYDPYTYVNRAQMASFVDRLQGAIQVALGGDPGGFATDLDYFPDDELADPHEGSINDLASVGIVEGTVGGAYQPGRAVIRVQMAKFIMRHVEVNIDAGVLDSAFPPATG